jgi:hypothetical protein
VTSSQNSLYLFIFLPSSIRLVLAFLFSSSPLIFVDCNGSGEDHGGRAVQGMNCLRSLERWDRGFESHSRHGCLCMRLFCVFVVLCR